MSKMNFALKNRNCLAMDPIDLLPDDLWGSVFDRLEDKRDRIDMMRVSSTFYRSLAIASRLRHLRISVRHEHDDIMPPLARDFIRHVEWFSTSVDDQMHMQRILSSLSAVQTLEVSSTQEDVHSRTVRGLCYLPEHLPLTLENLVLSDCSSLVSLPRYLPQSIRVLECPAGVFNTCDLPEKLPEGLRRFKFTFRPRSVCKSLVLIDDYLPEELKELIIVGDVVLPDRLPSRLRVLDLDGPHEASRRKPRLPAQMPEGLTTLRYEGAVSCAEGILAKNSRPLCLPSSLRSLELSFNIGKGNRERLPSLPTGLMVLRVIGCESIIFPDTLPSDLQEFEFHDLRIERLPRTLPEGLKRLSYYTCEMAESVVPFPELPSSLEVLHVSDVSRFLHPIHPLPGRLKSLVCCYISDSFSHPDVVSLPSEFPPNIEFLNYSNNDRLKALPEHLPPDLKTLRCSKCGLEALPELPSGLVTLVCNHNPIKRLPRLPEGLVTLHCIGCDFVDYSATGESPLPIQPSLPWSLQKLRTSSPELVAAAPRGCDVVVDNKRSDCDDD